MTVPRPNVRNLRPDEILVDHNVQRQLNKNFTKYLVDNWDDAKMGVPEVSHRGNHYYATDGQHRLAALIQLGRGSRPIPVLVVESTGRQDEAQRFVARNAENRRPSPIDIYRVQVVAGDEVAVAIDETVHKHGLRVETSVAAKGVVAAVGALRWVHTKGGTDLLDRTLGVIRHAYEYEPGAYNQTIIKGVAQVLVEYPGVDLDVLASKLSAAFTPQRLIAKARSLADAWRKSLHLAAADVIVSTYNLNKRTKRLQDA